MKEGNTHSFLCRLFGIYPGEERQAILFALLGYVWILAAASGLKFADALFLIHIGSSELPTVYVLTACGMIVFSSFLFFAFHHLNHLRVSQIVILIQASFYLGLLLLLKSEALEGTLWFWYALRIFGYLFFVMVITTFWVFIDQYHHLRDAKRLYCLFSSAIFLGLATTGAFMRAEIFELKQLLLLVLGLLVVVWFLIRYVAGRFTVVYDESDVEAVEETQSRGAFWSFVQGVLTSPYTLLVMANNFLIELLSWTTEYSYLSYFTDLFSQTGRSEEELLPFLGQLILVIGVANLFFALFVFSRLVRRYGVYSLLPVTPTLLLLAFSNWLYIDSLIFPVIGYAVVEGTIWVIDGNTFNLLLNGVPSHLKAKVRVFIEHVFEPGALLLGGLLIGWVKIDSRILTLMLSGGSLLVALALSRNYLKALMKNLSVKGVHFERTARERLSNLKKRVLRKIEHRLQALLKHGDDDSKLFACEVLLQLPDGPHLTQQVTYVQQMGQEYKLKWLKKVQAAGLTQENLVLTLLQSWIADIQEGPLRAKVFDTLAKEGMLHPDRAYSALESEYPLMKGAAITALKSSRGRFSHEKQTENRQKADAHIHQLLNSDEEDKICLGLHLLSYDDDPHLVDSLLPYIKHPSILVARQAMESIAGKIDKKSLWYASSLTNQLALRNDPEFQRSCLKALSKINDVATVREIVVASSHFRPSVRRYAETVLQKMGLRIVPLLLSLIEEEAIPYHSRLVAVNALGRLASEQLKQRLYHLVNYEIEKAAFYSYHYMTIQKRYSQFDLKPLEEALISSYHQILDFVFQLLGASGVISDCEVLSRCLRSKSARLRSQVIETLEKSCDVRLFKKIEPLIDDVPLFEKLMFLENQVNVTESLEEILLKLSQSCILSDKIVAATLMQRLELPRWREVIRKQMTSQEELFHHFAYELLER